MADGMLREKVALVTGAARGQGRSHAIEMAREGASIIAIDLCGRIATIPYAMSEPADLDETVKAVEAAGGEIFAAQADVRDQRQLDAAVLEGVSRFGRLDILSAGAGICGGGMPTLEMTDEEWQDVIDVDLTGVWHSCKAAVPHMRRGGRGGAIVITGSVASMKGIAHIGHYVAAKHGLVGLAKTLARELAEDGIRVNCVHPTTVDTPMGVNEASIRAFVPGKENPTREDMATVSLDLHALRIPWVDPIDVSRAVVFLSSDEARYITGVSLPVDAGLLVL